MSEFNPKDTSFTIEKIYRQADENHAAGSLDVTFHCDGTTHNLTGDMYDLNDADALKKALSDYATAYIQGIETTRANVSKSVDSLVGKQQNTEV